MGMWSVADLYGSTSKESTPASTEQTAPGGAVQRGASISWLAIIILFFVFRVAYEMAT